MIFAPEIWVFVFFLFFFKMLTDCWWLVSSHKSCPRQTSLIFYVEGGQNYWTWKVWAGKVFPELWHQIHGSEELVTVWISFQKFHACWTDGCSFVTICRLFLVWNMFDGKTDTACICQFPIRKLGSLHRSLAKEEICGRYHGLVCRKSKPLNIFIFAEVKPCTALEDKVGTQTYTFEIKVWKLSYAGHSFQKIYHVPWPMDALWRSTVTDPVGIWKYQCLTNLLTFWPW